MPLPAPFAARLILPASALLVALALGAAGAARLTQPLDGARNAVAETNLGNLAADAVRAAVGADFALVQASVLQLAAVPVGEISDDQLRSLLVFPDDAITVLEMTGERMVEALERSLSLLPHPNKGFLQVSGMRVRYDPARPAGSRVQSVTVLATNAPLQADRTYRVAAPDALAKGALGYFRVFNTLPRRRTDLTLYDALARHAAANPQIAARVEGRIQGT